MRLLQTLLRPRVSGTALVLGLALIGPWTVVGAAPRATSSPGPWTLQAKLTAWPGGAVSNFGSAVALSGDTALVGDNSANNYAGAAYIFVRSGGAWTRQATLLPSDGQGSDLFGQSVALDGDTALVGAIGHNSSTGAVYVFVRSGTTWTQQAELIGTGGGVPGSFGWSVALSGNTALVGLQGGGTPPYSGVAFVFVRQGTTWTQQAVISDPVPNSSDYFAGSVALHGDTALIGAPWAFQPAGVAYAFVRQGTTWVQQARLSASDGREDNNFGDTVILNGDTALVTAPSADHGHGAVYLFGHSGATWTQQAKLTPGAGTSVGQFGVSAALSGDTALIGAASGSLLTGMAYVFVGSGATWSRQARLTEPDSPSQNQFGRQVAVSGNTALISGEVGEQSNNGAVYVYVRGTTGT